MIKESRITEELKLVMEENKLEKSFFSIIEEFFFRLSRQQNWSEYDLNIAMYRFKRTKDIKFENLWENKILYKQKKIYGSLLNEF